MLSPRWGRCARPARPAGRAAARKPTLCGRGRAGGGGGGAQGGA